MNDFFDKLPENAKSAYADHKKVKEKKEKIKGYLDDITKLHTVASHLLEPRVNSSSVLLKLAYEGVERLAKKYAGNAPVVMFFFRYHQPHMNLFANVLQASNEAQLALNWQKAASVTAKQLEETVDDIVAKNGFAGSMLDGNQKLSKNVPQDFHDFIKYATHDPAEDMKGAMQQASSARSARWIEYEQDRLGQVILANARDIAGAYLAVAAETNKFSTSTFEAKKAYRKLKKGETDVDSAFGLMAQKALQEAAYMAGGTLPGSSSFDEVQHFTDGNLTLTPSFQSVGQSYRRMRNLSNKWKAWAELVASGDHLIHY